MIEKIDIHKVATYTNPISIEPRVINFIYGSNGSGKTTLTNILGQTPYPLGCRVEWKDGRKIPVLIYNKKFVSENFALNKNISGIFTLGKDTKEAQEFISNKREEVEECVRLINRFNISKNKLMNELNETTNAIEEICWTAQQKYGSKFSEALSGFRGSKKSFAKKCLEEYSNMDEKNVPELKDIEKIYDTAFGKEQVTYPSYKTIDIEELLKNEECSLLEKRITGSDETLIGKFIEYLGNSDWVKIGIDYAKKSNGKCPYCQKELPINVQEDIEAFFDEEYEKDCRLVKQFESHYVSYTNSLISYLNSIKGNPISFLDYNLFISEFEILSTRIDASKKIIKEKVSSPATIVGIDSIASLAKRINKIIEDFNLEIEKNNAIVKNQNSEQRRSKKLLWQYITYELRTPIKQYKKEYNGYVEGIKALTNKIKEQSEKESKFRKLIAEKEETLTSVIPTVNAINGILKRFGFEGFKLEENPDEKSTYRITRPDGSNAQNTLSEGEYNFITFLYFYYLVYGSNEKTGIANDKVVIIDDPISSLDSNVLFIISTLVKNLLNDCLEKQNGIKQTFILTHNVYFHKEVTFLGSRREYPTSDTAYWILKKTNNVSDIIYYKDNPIQTSYELLWTELKNANDHQRITIFNTLRRILEYYFNVIGGLDYETCINHFEGEDKIVCKGLISCINDGSHFISDDFVMCYESETMDNYLRVFRLIFERMGHESHYRMMMGESENVTEAATTIC